MRSGAAAMLGLSSLEALPLQFGNFIYETLYFLVLADRVANRIVQGLRNAPLARLAGLALHQIQGGVAFACGAMAIRLAALARALRKRAAQKPFAGGELGDARTKTALSSGEFGATEVAVHVLYTLYIRQGPKTRAKTKCEYARMSPQVRMTSKQQ